MRGKDHVISGAGKVRDRMRGECEERLVVTGPKLEEIEDWEEILLALDLSTEDDATLVETAIEVEIELPLVE